MENIYPNYLITNFEYILTLLWAMLKRCLVCNAKWVVISTQKVKGYHGIWLYDIYTCKHCDSHQIDSSAVDYTIYDEIYKQVENTMGYERYFKYSNLVLENEYPLNFLWMYENTYYPIYDILSKETKICEVLEVWCGLWYLSYAINKQWHHCLWVDISAIAVESAIKKYGNFYKTGMTDIISSKKKFDYIIATELIEHVPSPYLFTEELSALLNVWGKIIYTTPNKSFYKKESIWMWDLPPIHTTRITEKWLKECWKNNGLDVEIYSMLFLQNNENLLLTYLINYIKQYIFWKKIEAPHLIVDQKKPSRKAVVAYILQFFSYKPIKYLSNAFYRVFFKRTANMCMIFTKSI